MNISDTNNLRACTSCQLCAAVCPKDAISIQLNCDGFYRPVIDANACIDCGLCKTVCYKYDSNLQITSLHDLETKPLYAAWSTDDNLVKNTTSGGIGDLLARQLISEGYKVVGVAYNDDTARAEHHIAHSIEETIPFRGSKYVQSYTLDAMKEIVSTCKDEKYAVFGTPCQIYALNKLANRKKVRDHFFFVDLYCHGCPSLHVWTKYQQYIKDKLSIDRFDKVEFRSKIKGWGNYYVVVVVDGKTVFISNPKEDGFYELFFSNQVLNDGCTDCKLRGTLDYTDIRLGDFWGKKFLDNHRGVSAVSIATDKGQTIFKKIQSQLQATECDYAVFLPNQSWSQVYQLNMKARESILKSLGNPDDTILDAVKEYRRHQGLKSKFMRHFKNILYYCPQGITTFLKKIR